MVPAMIMLKMTVKGEKPPVYREGVVPLNITFTQLALILEEMLELPKSSQFEFEFAEKGEKIREKKGAEPREEGYRFIDSDGTYINDWMEHEDGFSFRILDGKGLPDQKYVQYQAEAEGRQERGTEYRSPLLTRVCRPAECSYWTRGEWEINQILRDQYALKKSDAPLYSSLSELKAKMDQKESGVFWSANPLTRVYKESRSLPGVAGGLADLFGKVAQDNMEEILLLQDCIGRPESELTGEQKAAMDKIADALKAHTDSWLEGVQKEKNVVTQVSCEDTKSLESFLSSYNRKDLEKIAGRLGISTYRRAEKRLAHEIAGLILSPDHMRKVLLKFSGQALDSFEKNLGRGIFSATAEENMELTPFMTEYYVCTLTDGFLMIPEDVAAAYRTLQKPGYRDFHRKADWLVRCEICFCKVLAAAPFEVFYQMFLRNKEMEGMRKEDLRSLMSQLPEENQWCTAEDGNVYAAWAVKANEDDPDIGAHILSEQASRNVPYYIPTKEEIEHYATEDYPAWEPSYKAMEEFYKNDMKLPEMQVYAILAKEAEISSAGAYMKEFSESEEGQSLVFASEEQLNRFGRLYADAHSHTRMCIMKGHTPEEMSTLQKDGERQNTLLVSNAHFNVSFDPSTIKGEPVMLQDPKKIYPNDPCPCGSGKKYKKCHGKKG